MKRSSSLHRRTLAFLAVIAPLLALFFYVALGSAPLDNVALLPMLAGAANSEARQHELELLRALDVERRAEAMPSQLSGGEQQRVAISQGLVNHSLVILADEPTALLDSAPLFATE